jgi:transcriptional regulator with XRE-family HTH domain
MDAPSWTIGDRLRKARRTAGLSRDAIAARLGVSVGTVSRYEADLVAPRRPTIWLWAVACDVDPDWIEGRS